MGGVILNENIITSIGCSNFHFFFLPRQHLLVSGSGKQRDVLNQARRVCLQRIEQIRNYMEHPVTTGFFSAYNKISDYFISLCIILVFQDLNLYIQYNFIPVFSIKLISILKYLHSSISAGAYCYAKSVLLRYYFNIIWKFLSIWAELRVNGANNWCHCQISSNLKTI